MGQHNAAITGNKDIENSRIYIGQKPNNNKENSNANRYRRT